MKIILTQLDIEEAIRAHISNVITVTEGTNVTIELASPRGSNEIQATVNLVSQAEQQAAYRSTVLEAPAPARAASPRSTSEPQAASKPAVESEPKAEPEVASGDGQDTPAAEEAVPAAPAKSLFGNLSRPRN